MAQAAMASGVGLARAGVARQGVHCPQQLLRRRRRASEAAVTFSSAVLTGGMGAADFACIMEAVLGFFLAPRQCST
jgi:hypothetical protein